MSLRVRIGKRGRINIAWRRFLLWPGFSLIIIVSKEVLATTFLPPLPYGFKVEIWVWSHWCHLTSRQLVPPELHLYVSFLPVIHFVFDISCLILSLLLLSNKYLIWIEIIGSDWLEKSQQRQPSKKKLFWLLCDVVEANHFVFITRKKYAHAVKRSSHSSTY